MKLTHAAMAPSRPNPHRADARKVCDSPHAPAVVIPLEPGEAPKKQVTPADVSFSVLEGTGIVEIGDERAQAGKDVVVESPARIPHRWIKGSKDRFRVPVARVPRPTEEAKLL